VFTFVLFYYTVEGKKKKKKRHRVYTFGEISGVIMAKGFKPAHGISQDFCEMAE